MMMTILLPYAVGGLLIASCALGFTTTTNAAKFAVKRPVLGSSPPSPPSIIEHSRHRERVLLPLAAASPARRGGSASINEGAGRTLSPKQILHPEIYPSPPSSSSSSPTTTSSDDDDAVPLFVGLRLLTKSLESIINDDDENNNNPLLGGQYLHGVSILRIEQNISSPRSIDPLCWLHAQQTQINNLRNNNNGNGNNNNSNDPTTTTTSTTQLPVMYFKDIEGHVDVATIGAAAAASSSSTTHHHHRSDARDPFAGKRIWDDDDGMSSNDVIGNDEGMSSSDGGDDDDGKSISRTFKEGELPPGSRIYGGHRFDWELYDDKVMNDEEKAASTTTTNSNNNDNVERTEDWDGFGGDGGGYWILPAIELRRETTTTTTTADVVTDESSNVGGVKVVTTTLSIHLHNIFSSSRMENKHRRHHEGWKDAAITVLNILRELTDELSPAVPCTTLPPVITRSECTGYDNNNNNADSGGGGGDSSLTFESGVAEALRQINHPNRGDSSGGSGSNDGLLLRKVVLARKQDLNFDSSVSGLDILMRLKFGGHIGHLFYMNPDNDRVNSIGPSVRSNEGRIVIQSREFLGCTPERLFRIHKSGHDRIVTTEALAGTRIRGLTPSADNELLRELLSSKKDMLENEITAQYITAALLELETNGWLKKRSDDMLPSEHNGQYFVRRLRHLQHICQTFEGKLSPSASVIDVSRSLLKGLHPTPAVCGDSPDTALELIRKYESTVFDRGYYAGPFGYIGRDSADVVVAIRSALVTNYDNCPKSARMQHSYVADNNVIHGEPPISKVSIFGGAGIVKGSMVQNEWTEISHKLGVLASLFRASPITLQSYSTPNVAWTTAFIEELVRSGVTQFYICPGSRNTPLTASIFKAMRSNVGVVRAISVHDERGAGFRAIGYARQNGRPAVVVTSSGTAVANLYPSVVEASSDGVPLILLTADRPYENRDNGSNQSIDQVKIFSSSYIRWFRDILPPSDDVPVSIALSDANHAVTVTKQLMGPVHLNIQFRENLAPESGPIRNDVRSGSTTKFNNIRFTDVPGFSRWSRTGSRWQDAYYPSKNDGQSVRDVVELIVKSRRGIIVTGNMRGNDSLTAVISHFAEVIGFPIFAGVQSGELRRLRPAVPYAEYLLKNPLVSKGMQPDLVLQLGSPIISTEIWQVIKSNPSVKHVLVQKLYQQERADPEQTVTHRISSDVGNFLNSLITCLDGYGGGLLVNKNYGSELSPLIYLGRELGKKIQPIILDATTKSASNDEEVCWDVCPENEGDVVSLTEPQVMMAISEVLSESSPEQSLSSMSLFLSNSMPVRDGESFFYPTKRNQSTSLSLTVSVNRGASGIDGIISTATGCADNSNPTTLVCGDVTTIHDLNALYCLTQDEISSNDAQAPSTTNRIPLTTVVVNNGGGAIFSFLPISKFGQDVGFEEFWGTPTNNFSFQKGAAAFGLPYKLAASYEAFKDAYRTGIHSGGPTVIEAKVVGRATNVDVHQSIAHEARGVVDIILGPPPARDRLLPVTQYRRSLEGKKSKTMLLLHGWMGDKSDWDTVGDALSRELSDEWNIISIDIPGHGDSTVVMSSDQQVAHSSLGLDAMQPFGPPQNSPFTLDMIARAVCHSLIHDHGVEQLDAIVGYSLGGRIALAMKRLYSTTISSMESELGCQPSSMFVTDNTQLILLSSSPGKLPCNTNNDSQSGGADPQQRLLNDFTTAESLFSSGYRAYVASEAQDSERLVRFLENWYTQPLWGDIRERHPLKHQTMMNKRLASLVLRRQDIASVLYGCSPSLSSQDDWKAVVSSKTLYVAGQLDKKYSHIGRKWEEIRGIAHFIELENTGHAVVVEEPLKVALIISDFVNNDGAVDYSDKAEKEFKQHQEGIINKLSVLEEKVLLSQLHQVGIMEYDAFSINVESSDGSGLQGIGWGDNSRVGRGLQRREGFIISIASRDGMAVGVGEVSPLKGLHTESLDESEQQLKLISNYLASDSLNWPEFDVKRVLSLDGSLTQCVNSIFCRAGIGELSALQSVRSGLEMAVLSMSSQLSGTPLPQALVTSQRFQRLRSSIPQSCGQLPISGLITRGEIATSRVMDIQRRGKEITFPSMKVKVGHEHPSKDAHYMIQLKKSSSNGRMRLRADANRAWDIPTAKVFITELKMAAQDENVALNEIEFIEEPLEKQVIDGKWSFIDQLTALETVTKGEDVRFALDESLADLAAIHSYVFDEIARELRNVFGGNSVGQTCCAAFVLKPALLGLELSMRLAMLAQEEFRISIVFSSSFDSGIGLTYAAILASVSDNSPHSSGLTNYSHGLGTFDKLVGDTLSPPFESYVTDKGLLNVPSLARAIYGLSLDEMSDRIGTVARTKPSKNTAVTSTESDTYLATTSFTSGRDITVSVSLPLPFSDRIASSRFTDLPQMSRWSPWLNSVTYLDESPGMTEWNLSIRGVKFSWKAKSDILTNPRRGIRWDSISGLKNRGVVEFEPTTEDSCIMKLQMSIIMPYILVALFQGIPSAVQEFLQNKLLKWSLEMFRDVVKADLALERGDQELGDALFGAVEGRANALEEALK